MSGFWNSTENGSKNNLQSDAVSLLQSAHFCPSAPIQFQKFNQLLILLNHFNFFCSSILSRKAVACILFAVSIKC
jgi:hypothetical protein